MAEARDGRSRDGLLSRELVDPGVYSPNSIDLSLELQSCVGEASSTSDTQSNNTAQ